MWSKSNTYGVSGERFLSVHGNDAKTQRKKKPAKLVHKLQTCHIDDVRSGVIGCYAAFRTAIGTDTQVCMQFACG